MSSSSSADRPLSLRGKVVRGGVTVRAASLDLDLSSLSSRAFDPRRVDEATADGFRDGYKAGHAEGFVAGHAEGAEAARVELAHDRRQLGALLVSLRDQLHALATREEDLLRHAEQAIVEGALGLAAAAVGHEVAVAANPGRDALARALGLAPTGIATALVRMHPEDIERLGPVDDLALGTTLSIVADLTIERGGCVLSGGDCEIDAQLGPALQRSRDRMLEA